MTLCQNIAYKTRAPNHNYRLLELNLLKEIYGAMQSHNEALFEYWNMKHYLNIGKVII